MQLPNVDVILLSWNRSQMTLETVQSLLGQEGINLKIWIVDQGSRPEELKLLKDAVQGYANIHIEELTHNIGVPGGRNVGTRLGNFEYTVSIDNDAVFESPYALKKVVEIFEGDSHIGAISFRIKNFYTQLDDELSWVYPKRLKSKRNESFLVTRFVGCGHAIRRNIFEQTNGYDDDLFFCWEEIEFSYRIINLGYQLLYAPEIVVLHKVAPEARVRWKDKRLYFHVRNAMYTDFKYNQSIYRLFILTIGYITKGCCNFIIVPTLRAVTDAYRMCFSIRSKLDMFKLNENAKDYIWKYETYYRGKFWDRLMNEVFSQLPENN